MSKPTETPINLPAATQSVYSSLAGLPAEDMVRVIRAALILLGVEATVEVE
jgi:hypothetical protein